MHACMQSLEQVLENSNNKPTNLNLSNMKRENGTTPSPWDDPMY